jgi:putative nucleotidyltransferase with HDIG domain
VRIFGRETWTGIERATNTQILDWAEAQPWTRDTATCQQDAQWHAEGDVWTHTKMVCAELEKLVEWPALYHATRLRLPLAGLFHDSGKSATTALDSEAGRTRSPKHALVGAEIARRVLRELECDLVTREETAALVRFHGRPPYLLEKEKPEHEVISLSWLVNNRLLYLFAIADTRGRHANEMSRPEENLHLWKLVAEERGCFDRPYAFANEHARFLFYNEAPGQFQRNPKGGLSFGRRRCCSLLTDPLRDMLVACAWPPPKIHCRECIVISETAH